jgi:WD40 repeat protein
VDGVAFGPDGKLLATANGDDTVGLWDPVTGQASGGFSGRNGVAFSLDGKLLAAAGTDGTVRTWDLATRRPAGPPCRLTPGAS